MSEGVAAGNSIVAIIALYNGAKYIERSLGSVLAQTLQPDEIIVVDDGSTDDGLGAALVEGFRKENPRIRLLRKANGGQSSTRNFGVKNSSGKLIALLDQDDAWCRTADVRATPVRATDVAVTDTCVLFVSLTSVAPTFCGDWLRANCQRGDKTCRQKRCKADGSTQPFAQHVRTPLRTCCHGRHQHRLWAAPGRRPVACRKPARSPTRPQH